MQLDESRVSIELVQFLREKKIIGNKENILSVEKPGEGNMNIVLRISTDKQTFILKQSKNYVQKYPQIEAPIERILVEAEFYNTISNNKYLAEKMPKLLAFFPDDYLLVLEDLGQNSDYTNIYKSEKNIDTKEIISLIKFLDKLHSLKINDFSENTALKKLNHFHIFNFPFDSNNGFVLNLIQEGLQHISEKYKVDETLKSKIAKLGELYLNTGTTLIHGDFYPGSWLKTENKIKIIDPEFGYLGQPEFDLGILIGHLKMAKKEEFIKYIFENYLHKIDSKLVYAFAGIEIMRRILGVAQLPLSLSIHEKEILLEWAAVQINKWNR